MLHLPNGCKIGKLSVHPQNWESSDADLSIEWYLHYRFYDPLEKAYRLLGDSTTKKKMGNALVHIYAAIRQLGYQGCVGPKVPINLKADPVPVALSLDKSREYLSRFQRPDSQETPASNKIRSGITMVIEASWMAIRE